jgi:uncharacterized peroxidase-related enzyme
VNRITQLDPAQASDKTKRLFEQLQKQLGLVPNLHRVLATAPAALEGYFNLSRALAGGSLDGKIREQIAITVAESNLCNYCLSAHAFIGRKIGLTEWDIENARRAHAATAKTDAILKLARNVVVLRGQVSDADLDRARACGVTDGEIIETIANVVVNIFSNYVNHVAHTAVDFPEVRPGHLAARAED